ncbi:MAG TPA: abscisic acid-deficient protein Aba4 family protein [Allosphingosinicella sp.]|nr:abscisic acid-deficient protein Aba4 family protein [Allosphingosinicella sp.]
MLTLETWFIAAHAVAFVGWAALFASPWIGRRRAVLAARWAAVPLCLLYLLFLSTHLKAIPTDLGYTLEAIARFFDKPVLLLVGWIHYLALDLVVGSWEVEHSERSGVSNLALLPCLFATMMIGPLGLLLYLGISAWKSRRPSEGWDPKG